MYLKDVSTILAIVSAVREGDLKKHFSAEREFLKLMFAFDHINYAGYITYQDVLLRKDTSIVKDLITNVHHVLGTRSVPFSNIRTEFGDLRSIRSEYSKIRTRKICSK